VGSSAPAAASDGGARRLDFGLEWRGLQTGTATAGRASLPPPVYCEMMLRLPFDPAAARRQGIG
jgi:hypothetical protein